MNAPLDPISDFRPDGYGLDDRRRERMRARVLDAIPDAPAAATLVAAPAPAEALVTVAEHPDPWVVEFGSGLDRRLDSGPRRRRGHDPHDSHRSNSRRLLVAAAVAVAIGLLAVVAGNSRSSDRQAGTLDQSSPVVTLDDLATVAATQPDRTLAPGETQYLEFTQAIRRDDGGFDITVDHNWHGIDGSGHRQTDTMVRPEGALPGGEIDHATTPTVTDPPGGAWFGPFSYAELRSAPTDPAALLTAATAASPGQPSWAVAEQIAVLESLATTPPEVRAAGLRALATLGFRPIGMVTDPLGHTGAGFQASTTDRTEILAFDPLTGRALGYWSGPGRAAIAPGDAARWGAFGNDAPSAQPG